MGGVGGWKLRGEGCETRIKRQEGGRREESAEGTGRGGAGGKIGR